MRPPMRGRGSHRRKPHSCKEQPKYWIAVRCRTLATDRGTRAPMFPGVVHVGLQNSAPPRSAIQNARFHAPNNYSQHIFLFGRGPKSAGSTSRDAEKVIFASFESLL